MNVEEIIANLKKSYPGRNIVQNKDEKGEVTEILCEVEPVSEHPEFSKAIAIIDSSTPHYHKEIKETYTVLQGTLDLFIDDEKITLQKGDSYTIPTNSTHYAVGNETWIEAYSEPGWYFEDHLTIKS